MSIALFDDGMVAAAAAGLSLSPPAPGAGPSSFSAGHHIDPAATDLSSAFGAALDDPVNTTTTNVCETTKMCDVLSFIVTTPSRHPLDAADMELFTPRGGDQGTGNGEDAASPTMVTAIHGLSVSQPRQLHDEDGDATTCEKLDDDGVIALAPSAEALMPTHEARPDENKVALEKEVWAAAMHDANDGQPALTAMSSQLSPDFHSMACSPQSTAVAGQASSRRPGQATLLAQLSASPVSKKPSDIADQEPIVLPTATSPQGLTQQQADEEACCFIRVKLIDAAAGGMPPLKLKVPQSLRFAKLFEHRVMRQVFGDSAADGSSCMLMWRGAQLDLASTPMEVEMPSGIGAVQTVEAISTRTVAETQKEMELRLQLREAKAKSDLLEFQLRRQTSSPQPHHPSSAQRRTASSDVMAVHALEEEMLEAAKRRSAREYAKEKKQEAAYWKHQFECAAKELALVKVLVAQQAAVLDRLGVPSFPFPDALVGSAFVHKSYNFDDAVSPCFASM